MEFSAAVRISLARFTSTYCEPLASTFSGPVIRLRSVRTSQDRVRLLAILSADPRLRGPLAFPADVGGAARACTAPAPWDTSSKPHARPERIPRRRRVLVLDVTWAAAEVSRLVHEARDLNLPVEPGVRPGRDALVRWAILLEDVIP